MRSAAPECQSKSALRPKRCPFRQDTLERLRVGQSTLPRWWNAAVRAAKSHGRVQGQGRAPGQFLRNALRDSTRISLSARAEGRLVLARPARPTCSNRAALGNTWRKAFLSRVSPQKRTGKTSADVDLVFRAFGAIAQIERRLHTDHRGYIAELLAGAVSRNALDQELTAQDRERLPNKLKEFGDPQDDYIYVD